MVARLLADMETLTYRVYTTDTLQQIAKAQQGGSYLSKRYADLIDSGPRDTRTGDEIAADVIARCGLVVT
jgi:hypothetical protein